MVFQFWSSGFQDILSSDAQPGSMLTELEVEERGLLRC
jgi:hypothetical protein